MGWGNEPHEGYAEQQRDTGEWTNGSWRGGWGDAVAERAACSCGWRGTVVHSLAPSPDLDSPAWPSHEAELERVDELIYAEWRVEHYAPLLGYDPSQTLILGRDDGGQRHFLDGQPVHAGTLLELLLPDGRWQPIGYEWGWSVDEPPTATMRLGAPAGAEQLGDQPSVTFDLPAEAVLRWPPR
jgi:hypothetical protein